MNKRERVMAALAGQPVDRVPASFWGHDFLREWTAQGLADAMLESFPFLASQHYQTWEAQVNRDSISQHLTSFPAVLLFSLQATGTSGAKSSYC
jgi:hypothetical protein